MPEPTSDSLNAAIATALGIQKVFKCPDCGSTYGGACDGFDPDGEWECQGSSRTGLFVCRWRGPWSAVPPPPFDTDGNAMLELIAAMLAKGFHFGNYGPSPLTPTYYASFMEMNGDREASVEAASFPLAVRDAAARALGLAVGGEGTR